MVVERKQSTIQRPAYECKSHLRGRSFFVTILNNMTRIKNYTRECMASVFGAGLKLHIQKGGMS